MGISKIQKTEIIEKTSLSEITLGNGNVKYKYRFKRRIIL